MRGGKLHLSDRRFDFVAGTGLLWILIAAAGCGSGTASESTTSAAAPVRPVVTRGTFRSSLALTGELQAAQAAKVRVPRTPLWRMAIRWLEEDGAAVVEGQKIVELDNTQFSGDLEQKRLAESNALNELMRKEADIAMDLADREYRLDQARVQLEKARIDAAIPEQLRSRREHQEKQLALFKAEIELDKATEDLDAGREAATAQLDELRLAYEKAKREVRQAEEAIEALTLRAPRDGILVIEENRREGRKFQTGDMVFVGQPVVSIPELSSMRVEAKLSDVDDGKIAEAMRVNCVLDTYPDEIIAGEVTEITPIAKEQGNESRRRAFRVLIRLEGTDPERMRPGMSVRAEVLHPPREDVLLVPRFALDFSEETPRALLSDGSWEDVRLGPCNAMQCVVEEGLREGQRVGNRG